MAEAYVLITKRTEFCAQAGRIWNDAFGDRGIWLDGNLGDPWPERLSSGRYKVLVSFLSPWIVQQSVLDRAEIALNFHPGSCMYPGIGCYNFALYENAHEFGAVCHHMLSKVDTGNIVEERLFPVTQSDTVETLKFKTLEIMLAMYKDIVQLLKDAKPLPRADTHWKRRPFKRKELNDLCIITPQMSADEIMRRVRAVTYPGHHGARVTLGGVDFFRSYPYAQAGSIAIPDKGARSLC